MRIIPNMDKRVLVLPYYWCVRTFFHFRHTWLNGRLAANVVADVIINLLPLALWMLITKAVLWIPYRMRPPIHVRLCKRLDAYVFSFGQYWIGSVLSLICIFSGGWLLYSRFYKTLSPPLHDVLELNRVAPSNPTSASSSDYEHEVGIKQWRDELVSKQDFHRSYKWIPLILTFSSWFLLNFIYQFHQPFTDSKGIMAWVFYVVLHFLVTPTTITWLYLFHPQGAAGLFCWCLGSQNVGVILTHFIFPNAPPLYIRVYGDNKSPSYDMKFTDGISRSDMKIGPHIHKAVYYATPSQFGALPSVHSATAVMAFLFVCYYSRYRFIKVLAFMYIVCQWWAAVYSEHHWRIDLLVGMMYALGSFTFFHDYTKDFQKLDAKFLKARIRGDYRVGTTAGMRLIANTRLLKWFDPLS